MPAVWRNRFPWVRFQMTDGNTRTNASTYIWVNPEVLDPPALLGYALAHEFGHKIAYRFGTGAYFGAPPAGWPESGGDDSEAWADCVASAFGHGGVSAPHYPGSHCSGDRLAFARSFLAAGPPG